MKKNIIFIFIPSIIIIGMIILLKNEMTQANSKPNTFVALGDSITYGTGDEKNKGYLTMFQEGYEKEIGTQIILKNFGIPKYRTLDILEQLRHKKEVRESIELADYLILFIGTNNLRKSLNYTFKTIDVKSVEKGKEQYSKDLEVIISKVRDIRQDIPIFVIGLYHPYTNYDNEEEFGNLIVQWNRVIKHKTVHFDNIFYVPTLDALSSPDVIYFSDGLHPNNAGHRIIARQLLDRLLEVEKIGKGT